MRDSDEQRTRPPVLGRVRREVKQVKQELFHVLRNAVCRLPLSHVDTGVFAGVPGPASVSKQAALNASAGLADVLSLKDVVLM